jgi:hypothetical protein
MPATPHHPDRLIPSSADALIKSKTGLDLPELLDCTLPLAKPLRLVRMELALVDRELKEVTSRLARSASIRLEQLTDHPVRVFAPVGEPTPRDLDTCTGMQAGLWKAVDSILAFWVADDPSDAYGQ